MKRAMMLGALLLACACGGCGSDGPAGGSGGTTITDTAAKVPVATDCAGATLEALERVGHSVYEESAGGRIVAEAIYRLENSRALAEAVARGDAAATRKVLRGLLLNQILSVQVMRGTRVLARIEQGTGIAPAAGRVLLDGVLVGTFTLTVQGANGYAQTTAGLTGSEVLIRSGSRELVSTLSATPGALRKGQRKVTVGGTSYRVDTFAGQAFPNHPASISLLVPSSSIAEICARGAAHPQSTAQARANAWGRVAERVYYAEHAGSKAELIKGVLERSRAFHEAVLTGNATATRAAIIGFFRSHLHVVRVRVMRAGRLLVDVGGPYVLAPIAGVIRDARGHVAAHFLFAIQDDLGFTILARAFTGAQTLMRVGSRQVMGTLHPGPVTIPDRGRLLYQGTSYQAYSFEGRAFPSGALRISLLYPAS